MIIGIIILLIILGFVFIGVACADYMHEEVWFGIDIAIWILILLVFIWGCFHGFINQPPTEGTHQGVITAVDLEGTYFRRYECYLKSSGYTNQSDETKYLLYDYEKDLAEELKNAIGKTVKIHYGHDGGYIAWNSCGTYHIKSIEIIDDNN